MSSNHASLRPLPLSLLLMRLGVLAVMLPWTLDKFVRPEHQAVSPPDAPLPVPKPGPCRRGQPAWA